MRLSMRRAAVSVLLSLLGFCGLGAAALAEPAELFSGAAADGASRSFASSTPAVRQRTVALNGAAFAQAAAQPAARSATPVELRITLFPDASAVFRESNAEAAYGGGSIWRGETANGDATLVLTRGQVTGQVSLKGKTYKISPAGGDVHEIVEVAVGRLPPDGPEMIPPPGPKASAPQAEPQSAPAAAERRAPTVVYLMTAYTPKTASLSANIVADVNLAVSLANTAYADSGVLIRLQLVGVRPTPGYNEDLYSFEQSLYNVSNLSSPPNAAAFSRLRGARNTLKADLVALFIQHPAYCGIAWLAETPNRASTSHLGYSVTSLSCISNKSFVHELGHNMGLRHDRYVEPTFPNSKYNFGFVNVSKRVRDIMAYNNRCAASGLNCVRQNLFSSPLKTVAGAPFGVQPNLPGAAFAARRLNETRTEIANYR